MVCIYCQGDTQVINSRLQKRLNHVWRRRQCLVCKGIFTTHEQADLATALSVRYNSAKLQPLERDRIMISIFEACKHRPTALEDARALTQTVIAALLGIAQQGIVDRTAIIATAHAVLERFDTTAAAVYRAYHKDM